MTRAQFLALITSENKSGGQRWVCHKIHITTGSFCSRKT